MSKIPAMIILIVGMYIFEGLLSLPEIYLDDYFTWGDFARRSLVRDIKDTALISGLRVGFLIVPHTYLYFKAASRGWITAPLSKSDILKLSMLNLCVHFTIFVIVTIMRREFPVDLNTLRSLARNPAVTIFLPLTLISPLVLSKIPIFRRLMDIAFE